ncbi:hypothetical protein TPDSLph2_CDS0021 [Terrisporobacter phage TPDSL_ph2]
MSFKFLSIFHRFHSFLSCLIKYMQTTKKSFYIFIKIIKNFMKLIEVFTYS